MFDEGDRCLMKVMVFHEGGGLMFDESDGVD